ncbi:MAG: CbiX/SirB N-terminal domain-containing protein [Candidatus Margulisiibacteriota bacterium]|jgi:sirohydrochlorin ferrochelatase
MKAIIIIDHGSRYVAANDFLQQVVERAQELTPDVLILGAHMELAEPSIPQVIKECVNKGVTHIIAHPYMLSPGRHAIRDIPNLVYDAASEYPNLIVEVTAPLGLDDGIINVIKQRCGIK